MGNAQTTTAHLPLNRQIGTQQHHDPVSTKVDTQDMTLNLPSIQNSPDSSENPSSGIFMWHAKELKIINDEIRRAHTGPIEVIYASEQDYKIDDPLYTATAVKQIFHRRQDDGKNAAQRSLVSQNTKGIQHDESAKNAKLPANEEPINPELKDALSTLRIDLYGNQYNDIKHVFVIGLGSMELNTPGATFRHRTVYETAKYLSSQSLYPFTFYFDDWIYTDNDRDLIKQVFASKVRVVFLKGEWQEQVFRRDCMIMVWGTNNPIRQQLADLMLNKCHEKWPKAVVCERGEDDVTNGAGFRDHTSEKARKWLAEYECQSGGTGFCNKHTRDITGSASLHILKSELKHHIGKIPIGPIDYEEYHGSISAR
ncbi:hypothetical protein P280DRAFT_478571 [Massarina eburnea CBS 473.64]|uniref:Uncharacterized protein n=1 Tax=Massarina eburnea CBS 473.64 TaxID=1395130 RepID=A0A6A6S3J0_9PLEO|nr:hypothetical protein P280DRAFT_478571 [Massarina eburnea CBS 473.64]